MDASVVTAVASAASALAVAAATYGLTKRRERDAEWRRFKLDHYREYVAALSGVTQAVPSPEAQRRYADALNTLALVAPPDVLRALYAYQDAAYWGNPHRSAEELDARLSAALGAIRRDVQPSVPDDARVVFRLFDVPPSGVRPANEAVTIQVLGRPA